MGEVAVVCGGEEQAASQTASTVPLGSSGLCLVSVHVILKLQHRLLLVAPRGNVWRCVLQKTNDVRCMLGVSVLVRTDSDRKIFDRVLRTKKTFAVTVLVKKNVLHSHGSPVAWSHAIAVSLSKFRMLTRWSRVGSFSCGLNNIPLVPKLRLPLQRRRYVGFMKSTCDVVPPFHGFVRAGFSCMHLVVVCVLFRLHKLGISSYVFFGNDVSQFDIRGFLDWEFLHNLVIFLCAIVIRLSSKSSPVLSSLSTVPSCQLILLSELTNTFLLHCVLDRFRSASSRR